ncbi:MAG: hypothetical protein HY057_13360 [Rhodospirillales bacterium]|nr:hypothetical protein [Rhodospirillales bacterium]
MKRLLSSAAVVVFFVATLGEAQARCLTKDERTAFQMRTLQTEMMVAALSCRNVPDRDFRPYYNSFVRKHGEWLASHSRVLQRYFQQQYGANGRYNMDKFTTALANETSQRSMADPAYCERSESLFYDVLAVDRHGIEDVAASRAAKQGDDTTCVSDASIPGMAR